MRVKYKNEGKIYFTCFFIIFILEFKKKKKNTLVIEISFFFFINFRQLLLSYVLATSGAVGTALGLNRNAHVSLFDHVSLTIYDLQ